MKLPIILNEGADISIFSSTKDLTGYVEVIDVQDRIFDAYDADGYPLILTVEIKKQLNLGWFSPTKEYIKLVEDPTAKQEADKLKQILTDMLNRAENIDLNSEKMNDLSYLIEKSIERLGYT